MKKTLIMVVALATLSVSSVSAQGFLDKLKGAATTVIDKVTGGKATEIMLPGTWNYDAPAMKLLSSDNILADVASSAAIKSVETKLTTAYEFVGIKPGSCSFTFNSDDTFTATFGKRTLSGTYTYDAASHAIELSFTSKINPGTMKGYAYLDGASMELVFDCTRLMNLLTKLGSKVQMLNGITSLMTNYDSMMLGFGFVREQ